MAKFLPIQAIESRAEAAGPVVWWRAAAASLCLVERAVRAECLEAARAVVWWGE
jgi:hypothetical protein|tara:strand:+ start:17 stop:178 length:162 start_codon:yes stop_codon:yes gene_type:complete